MRAKVGNWFDRNSKVHRGHDAASPVRQPRPERDGETEQRRLSGWDRIIMVLCARVSLGR